MAPDPFRHALILTGPTGSGKSRLALEVAERLDAEILSMDSMALYRGLDIGTAKPSAADRQRVRHHLLDVLDPWESASVAWWLQEAARACAEIEGRGKQVLIVGGTPLYLKALLRGLFDGPPADLELRKRLEAEATIRGGLVLHKRLKEVDPVTAERLHANDLRRVIRALEVQELTGRPISSWQSQWQGDVPPTEQTRPRCLWLDIPRHELYARIDNRVEEMIATGLVEEARRLRQLSQPLSREAGQALGYREMFDYLDGRLSREQAIRIIQTRSRQFAKRQLTWFRHLPEAVATTRELTFDRWGLTMG